jgi:hypothetical protein
MASREINSFENPEQREIRRRQQTKRRIRAMTVIFGLSIATRVFIKNPPPPKTPDYSKYKVRYVPGMLDAIPAAERAKMDPKVLARIQQADDEARNKRAGTPTPVYAAAKGPYKATEVPIASQTQEEKELQFEYVYAKQRQAKAQQLERQEIHDTTKSTVVEFAGGGYIFAERAARDGRVCKIKLDRNTIAAVPSTLVKSLRTDAAGWTPPLAKGEVMLKPARGITIVLQRQVANRITIPPLRLQ